MSQRRGVGRFEQLRVWQKARVLARAIYTVTSSGRFARDFGLSSQMQRAAVSIMSNIAEGFERFSDRELFRHLTIARGSCAELRSQLYLACDIGYIDELTFKRLLAQAEELANDIGSFRNSVRNRLDAS